jgi:protein transport protein SEC31
VSLELIGRLNRLAWGAPSATHPKGLIAAGMETGEVHVYDPEKILAGKRYVPMPMQGLMKSADESRIYTSHKHTGPVRGLDFNPIQKNLLASGAVNAEVSHSLQQYSTNPRSTFTT